MTGIVVTHRLDCGMSILLNESEARALDALVGYGDDAFIQEFKEKLGEHYIRDHEQGLRSLFQRLRQALPSELARIDEARRAFTGRKL